MASNTTLFTALPTEDEHVENDQSLEEKNPDQILDGLLAKVGYGLFQKKLLVKYNHLFHHTLFSLKKY